MKEYTATKKGILNALMPPPQELKTGGLKTGGLKNGALKTNRGMKNFARNNHAFKNDDGVITLQVVIITSVIVLAAVLASILIINLLRDESKHIEVVLASEQPQKLDPIAYSPTATAAPSKESRIPSFGYTGINHSCIVADKTIRCWGKNNEKQLGDGTYTSRSTPITVLGITGKAPETSAVQVSVAPSHTCARLENGTVKCWGTGYRDTPVTVLETTGSPLANVTKISVGVGHTCALLSTKEVKCWGNNYDGELGDGTTTNSSTPVPVSGITGMDSTSSATQVSAGGNHTCVVFENGAVKCWGSNRNGQLGDESLDDSHIPVMVSGITGGIDKVKNATQVFLGDAHSCAVLEDKTVKCWGYNRNGQVGDRKGENSFIRAPFSVSGITGTDSTNSAAQVFLGDAHSCAVLEDKTVKCWGINDAGQLGNGILLSSTIPVRISNIKNVIQVSAGDNHTCAVLSTGKVRCWGENGDGFRYGAGQLGDGTATNRYFPVEVLNMHNATQVSAGKLHTCAILEDKTVKCWGSNRNGQLGNGGNKYARNYSPVPVSGITGDTPATRAIGVFAGSYHTCVVFENGTVKCWGKNRDGQLGNGTTKNSSTPVPVSGITGINSTNSATQVSVGNDHTCARLENGAVKCWGYNALGQLGDGTKTQRLTPILASTITGDTPATRAIEVSVASNYRGNSHTCAVFEDGTMKCWGDNFNGQIGDGTSGWGNKRITPVLVPEITGTDSTNSATQVSTGQWYTCTILEDKTVNCWGANADGQLGDGTEIAKFTPVSTSYKEINITNGAIQISAGLYHACAVLEDKTVKCWGAVGLEPSDGNSVPVQVLLPKS